MLTAGAIVRGVGQPAAALEYSYSIGDRAMAEVTTPVALVVSDPAQTEALRRIEGQKVPPFFRRLPGAMAEGDEALRAGFAAMRTAFQERLRSAFGHPVPLLTVEYAQPRFEEALEAFRRSQPTFPLSRTLAEQWAFGNSGDALLQEWRQRFRQLADRQIRPDGLPAGERLASGSVRLLEEAVSRNIALTEAEQRSQTLGRTNLAALARVRQESIQAAAEGDRAVVGWLVEFLRPNCVFDPELTGQARARRTEAIHVVDRYRPGEVLVKEGEPITPKVQLALAELRARLAALRAEAAAALERSERSRAQAEKEAALHAAETTRRTNRWLAAGLATAAVLLLLLLWRALRHGRGGGRAAAESASAPWPTTGSDLALVSPDEGLGLDAEAWRDRALAAEARADRATALLRSGLLPHLARWMMGELVRRLVSHHAAMRLEQRHAEQEVSDLARRLEQLQAPIEERLRAYEKRITELETELAAKGAQNAQLIKAKIESTRKKLALERGERPAHWN